MKHILLTAAILITIAATAYFSYQHGLYVGKIDAQANTNALIQAGYIPEFIDSNQFTIIE